MPALARLKVPAVAHPPLTANQAIECDEKGSHQFVVGLNHSKAAFVHTGIPCNDAEVARIFDEAARDGLENRMQPDFPPYPGRRPSLSTRL